MTETQQRWTHIIAQWEASGLSKKKFCQKHGYSTNAFYTVYGRRRRSGIVTSQEFIRVLPDLATPPTIAGQRLTIRVNQRIVIEVPDPSMLGPVLKALGV